ncbi:MULTISPECIES: hypothetical protein [Flavobacterium]|uniref:hypothetical protein n=1 Tax=Flavobacterium TaxID=237 RepID=UPI0011841062|nr:MULTISPECIES: hypothetical protein [Flavobacterium]MCR4030286.1 hypothetical protein [Flavobacterium panacis]
MRKIIFIHVIVPLVIGGLIYISFRSLSLRMFDWFKWIHIDFITSLIRDIMYPFKRQIPTWFYFSLPDALWVYSFSSALLIIWKDQFKKGKYWLLIPLLSGSIVEIAQAVKLFPGTFDMIDLIFTTTALLFSIMLNSIFNQNEKHKKLF